MRQRTIIAITAGLALITPGCGGKTTAPPDGGSIRLELHAKTADDPREFSVGTILLRALDENGNILVPITPFSDEEIRATGHFDLDFAVPAGPNRTIVVEPRGSAIPPGGGKTGSGVALQGVSEPFNIEAGATVDLVIDLEPFIPDSLRIETDAQGDWLVWKKMIPAESHVIQYQEFVLRSGGIEERTLDVGEEGRVALDDLLTGANNVVDAFQIASVNELSISAFSDTLFR